MKKTLKKSITKYLKDNFDLLFIISYYEKFIECSFLCYKKCDSRLHDMMWTEILKKNYHLGWHYKILKIIVIELRK